MGKFSIYVASAFMTTALSLSDNVGVSAATLIQRQLAGRRIDSPSESQVSLKESNRHLLEDNIDYNEYLNEYETETRTLKQSSGKKGKGKLEKKPLWKIYLYGFLNWGMVAASGGVTVPEIIKMCKKVHAQKTLESNELSLWMGFGSNLFGALYAFKSGFPFKEWGESLLLLVQGFVKVMIFTIWGYFDTARPEFTLWYRLTLAGTAAITGITILLIPAKHLISVLKGGLLKALSVISIVVGLAGKIPQIYTGFTIGTGETSWITTLMRSTGNTVRIITTLAGSRDIFQLIQSSLGLILNVTMFIQVLVIGDTSTN